MGEDGGFGEIRTRMFPDLEALVVAGVPRAHTFGPSLVHFEGSGPVYLPADFDEQMQARIVEGTPLRDFSGRELSSAEHRAAAHVNQLLSAMARYSGARDYGRAAIGGDVSRRVRNMVVDGHEQDVLVFPQGALRAARSAQAMVDLRMSNHPLAGNAQAVLQAKARVLALATEFGGFTVGGALTPMDEVYLRDFMGGGPGSHGANRDPVMPGVFQTATLQFLPHAPYLLPPGKKMVFEAAQTLPGSHQAHLKHTSRYLDRVDLMLALADDGRAAEFVKQEFGVDLVFRGERDALRVDAVYTNLVYCAQDPTRAGWTVMAFPKPTTNNPFFLGMTATTLYRLLDEVGDQYNIRPVWVEDAQELADAVGYNGADPVQGAVMEKVDRMLGPGTYMGPQMISGYVTEDGKQKMFGENPQVEQAVKAALRLYTVACNALGDGLMVGDRCLAADPRNVVLLDVDAALHGQAEPLRYQTLQGPPVPEHLL